MIYKNTTWQSFSENNSNDEANDDNDNKNDRDHDASWRAPVQIGFTLRFFWIWRPCQVVSVANRFSTSNKLEFAQAFQGAGWGNKIRIITIPSAIVWDG